MTAAAHQAPATASPAEVARRVALLTLEDRVHLGLTSPDVMGCVVCGGGVRRKSGGVVCRDCGSELSWGAASRGVWVG